MKKIAIATITVETEQDSFSNRGSQDITELFKIERPIADDKGDNVGHCLFRFDNSGYAFLEALNTDDEETAIERAEAIVDEYCNVHDATIKSTTVTRREGWTDRDSE